ncbi:Ribose-5-phosphate isomerase A [Cytobacillus firmus]|uniref:Ribose-5-phosphate isomerase A n=1 Tax=Cytobacillus firmus TaxID=1399 RepID=A0A800N8Z3_CYTFI|nr:Ribose-5-phosphate isomerase A [Cytobacillus firmus]
MAHGNFGLSHVAAGEKAADFVKDGMIIGLGSGSTVYWFLKRLGELVNAGLTVKGVPSSLRNYILDCQFE